MRSLFTPCILALSFVIVLVSPVFNQQGRDEKKEGAIREQLAEIAPDAVDSFRAATAALDSGQVELAVEKYDEVLEIAPEFTPALRRSGGALAELGKREEGVQRVRKAVELERNYDNLVTLAYALSVPGEGEEELDYGAAREALAVAEEASNFESDDPEALVIAAQLSLFVGDMDAFFSSAEKLGERFPDQPISNYYTGIMAAELGDFDRARALLNKARGERIPDETIDEVIALVDKVEAETSWGLEPYLKGFGIVVGVWALGLAGLFGAGRFLSAKTLAWVENSDPNDVNDESQTALRKHYRRVINIAAVYYYLSQPILLGIVVVLVCGIIYFFLMIGRIPVYWILALIVVGAVTIYQMVKTLLVRPKGEEPGRVLAPEEAPRLWALVREVADTVQTRPVDEVRITPGTEMAVYERGGWRAKLRDKGERVLIVGVATLPGFSQNSFRAVLAHEYGHFSNRDTAGGDIALRVETDIIGFAEALYSSGAATVYNVGFHFLRLYHFLFRRITLGATRLQEVVADRVAVREFGADAFKEGLLHVIRSGHVFNMTAEQELISAKNNKRTVDNLYFPPRVKAVDPGTLSNLVGEEVNRPTTPDDSHPSPSDRFKYAARIDSVTLVPLEGEVWDLFTDRDGIEAEMTAEIISLMAAFSAQD
ncbi:MAG: M48 family metalloprotease [Aridibacter famidurans]|nr:M48 family metalloprotease [Aridibacter famidurans]